MVIDNHTIMIFFRIILFKILFLMLRFLQQGDMGPLGPKGDRGDSGELVGSVLLLIARINMTKNKDL